MMSYLLRWRRGKVRILEEAVTPQGPRLLQEGAAWAGDK